MLTPLATSAGVLNAYPTGLPPLTRVGLSPPILSIPPQGVHLVYPPDELWLVSARPPGGTACRVTPSWMRCSSAPPQWEGIGYPWPVVTMDGLWPKITLSFLRPGEIYPVVITLHLLSSCRAAWKRLYAVQRPLCYAGWFHHKTVLWYTRHQVSSYIHAVLTWVLRSGFLTYFQKSEKPHPLPTMSPLCGNNRPYRSYSKINEIPTFTVPEFSQDHLVVCGDSWIPDYDGVEILMVRT